MPRPAAGAAAAQGGGDAGAARVAATRDDLELGCSLVLSCNLSSDSSDANPPWPLAMLAVEPQKYHGGTPY